MAKRRRPKTVARPPRKKKATPPAPAPARSAPPAAGPASPERATPPSVHRCRPGPWGPLESYDTYLEAPDPVIGRLSLPSQQTVWHFPGSNRAKLAALFESAGLSEDQVRTLMDPGGWSVHGDLIRIFPPASLVESLAPHSRSAIYRVLAKSELNPFHHAPIQFDRGDLLQALDRSALPQQLVENIARLSYQEGHGTLFSDFPLLLRHITHPQRERQLLRILTRTRTLLLRVNLHTGDDLEELGRYWAAGPRQSSIRPVMESIVRTRGVDSLDLVHFLPPGPRSQLYTFPNHEDCISGRAPDGVWTAVNFFTYHPLPLYLESPGLSSHLATHFQPASPPFRFGDLLAISAREGNTLLHACVFLADDIVYTKNSANLLSPWILSKLTDVIAYHVREGGAMVRGFRPLEKAGA